MPSFAETSSSVRRWLKTALREPLTHFLLAGLALFLFFAWRGNTVDPASRTIVIDEAQVERLAASWAQTWQRAPRPAEIDGMIRDYIKEEIYNREAIRLGLDQNDIVIRRRLRNKMEYLQSAAVENAVPDEATLQKWLDRNAAKYAVGARVSFDQIYLAADGPDDAKARAREVQNTLAAGQDWRGAGDRISLSPSVELGDLSAVSREFGDAFAGVLSDLPIGEWAGPVASGFGYHLVRLRHRTPGKAAKLADVRQAVENDWRAATQKQRQERAYQTLLDGYTIRIARP